MKRPAPAPWPWLLCGLTRSAGPVAVLAAYAWRVWDSPPHLRNWPGLVLMAALVAGIVVWSFFAPWHAAKLRDCHRLHARDRSN